MLNEVKEEKQNHIIKNEEKQKHRIKNLLIDYMPEHKDNFNFEIMIPIPRFSMLNIAPSKSGKSNVSLHLLTDELVKTDIDGNKSSVFELVILMTQSATSDPLWAHVLNKPENAFLKKITYLTDQFDTDLIEETLKLPNNGKHRFILVDDFGDSKLLQNPVIKRAYMMGRHNNVSICVNVQDYYSVLPSIKANTQWMAIFNLNKKDREIAMCNDLAAQNINSDDVADMYSDATAEKFQFLWVNMQDRKFFSSFDFQYKIDN